MISSSFGIQLIPFLFAVLFFQSCRSYQSHGKRFGRSTTKCYDHNLIDGVICSNVDISWSQFAFQGAVAGGCRALSRGLTFPFDTLKTLEQTATTTPAPNTLNSPKQVENNDNLSKLKKLLSKDYFRGIIPAVASAVPANAVFFVVYNYLQTIAASECVLQYLSIDDTSFYQKTSILFIERLIFSAVATLPQNAIKIPAELIKQRAQVSPNTEIFSLIAEAIKGPIGIRGNQRHCCTYAYPL